VLLLPVRMRLNLSRKVNLARGPSEAGSGILSKVLLQKQWFAAGSAEQRAAAVKAKDCCKSNGLLRGARSKGPLRKLLVGAVHQIEKGSLDY
jgi:hypothetical protein